MTYPSIALAAILAGSLAGSLAGPAAAASGGEPVAQDDKNVPDFEPAFEHQTRAPAVKSRVQTATETVAEGLANPWGIEVLPDGNYLVTEREGRLRIVSRTGKIGNPLEGVPEVLAQNQGGLLDVKLAPDFEESRRIYLTFAKPLPDNKSATAAVYGVLSPDLTSLENVTEIFQQQPPSPTPMQYGSRIVIDGDYAYITTGEHFTPEERQLAQDLGSTYGKVVRVTTEGEVPDDNPFVDQGNALGEIWTLGHRNIQGAAIRPDDGQLWTLEHGPQGGDELNLIEMGANYGWPVVSYGEEYSGEPVGAGKTSAEGMTEPRYYWDPVIAPGGFAWYEGEMFPEWQGNIIAASLNPGGVVRLVLDGDQVTGEERLLNDLGRVRDVEIDRDGALLLLTDQRDGAIVRLVAEGDAGPAAPAQKPKSETAEEAGGDRKEDPPSGTGPRTADPRAADEEEADGEATSE